MKKAPKKRNDRTIFIVAVILFALAVGLFVGAYARFQTQVTGTGTLVTANWAFTVNGSSTTFEVDLASGTVFNTIPVTVSGETVHKIQPGSYGSFDLTLSAAGSEVPVTYNAEFGGLSGSVPANLALYSDSSYTTSLANVSGQVIQPGGTATVTIYWKWLYTETDETQYAAQTLNLPITITGYQVNPNSSTSGS